MRSPWSMMWLVLTVLVIPCATVFGQLEGVERTQAASACDSDAPNFLCDIMPLWTKYGCNTADCHGSAAGQGGLRLSLFGTDPGADFAAITQVDAGRLINTPEPAASLLLLRVTNTIPHTGGERIPLESQDYAALAAWIACGVPFGDQHQHAVGSVQLVPGDLVLTPGDRPQLQVRAEFADGHLRDVTRLACFATSAPEVGTVDAGGVFTAHGAGETVVFATYLRRTAVARVLVPQRLPFAFPEVAANNRIDELVFDKLRTLGIPPSPVCSDAVFLRRVHLDVIGALPTADEARAFLADPDPTKRARLIERLLARDEYADFWALKWGDLLRIKSEYPVRVWPRGVQTYYRWVHDSLAANVPYDQFVRELIMANGSDFQVGPANYYRAVPKRDPPSYAEATAALFLGARLECARCHAHPHERWDAEDVLGMAAFFSKVAIKTSQEWKEEIVYFNPHGAVLHPHRNDYVDPKLLGGETLALPRDQDPRPALAQWLTAPENERFAEVMANRVWCWLLGRGIVHEPDDFRTTNPPSHPELLAFLAREFVEHQFDVKHLFRLILNSKVYQLSSSPHEHNRFDRVHFSHYRLRRLGAEQLLDAVCQVTGTSDQFASWVPVPPTIMPAGSRAVQIFDGDIKNQLLDLFGRPLRDTPYECERKSGGSVRQSLHLVNSDHFEGKVAGSPTLHRLLQEHSTDQQVSEELYLATLTRYPTAEETRAFQDYRDGVGLMVSPEGAARVQAAEQAAAAAHAALEHAASAGEDTAAAAQQLAAATTALEEATAAIKPPRHQAFQDILWALLNTKEFLFNH